MTSIVLVFARTRSPASQSVRPSVRLSVLLYVLLLLLLLYCMYVSFSTTLSVERLCFVFRSSDLYSVLYSGSYEVRSHVVCYVRSLARSYSQLASTQLLPCSLAHSRAINFYGRPTFRAGQICLPRIHISCVLYSVYVRIYSAILLY